nr:diguanylate cyclase [Methylomarinum vadi]
MLNCAPEQAVNIMEKQRERFNKMKFADLALTASIGVSGIVDYREGKSLQQLFKQADGAVYAAKASGRDRIRLN